MELALPLTLLLVVMAITWGFFQLRALNQRLTSLEKQHMALVEDLELRIYSEKALNSRARQAYDSLGGGNE